MIAHRSVALVAAICLSAVAAARAEDSGRPALAGVDKPIAAAEGAACPLPDLEVSAVEDVAGGIHRVCWWPGSCRQLDQQHLPLLVRLARCLDANRRQPHAFSNAPVMSAAMED